MSYLRPFTLQSDDLSYSANVAQPRFPTVPKGSARCAVVGMRYLLAGDDAAVMAAIDGWGSVLTRFTIAGRSYMQGYIPFPLIAASMTPNLAASPFGMPQFNRFLGSQLPLAGQMQGAGMMGAGMALGPADEVRATVERYSDDCYVRRIVLDCIQWPDDQKDPLHSIWDQLRKVGLGEPYFIGSRTTWPAAGATVTFDELPQPPLARVLRRTGFRHGLTTTRGDPSNRENGAVGDRTSNNLLAQIWTSFQRPPQNNPAPIRTIMGLPGLEIPTGTVDMQVDERSVAAITNIGSAAASADYYLFALHMFEGRDINAPTLEAANAIS